MSTLEKPNEQLMKQYGVTAISQQTRVTTEGLDKLTQLIEQGIVTVHVEKTFLLDQAALALAYLEHIPPEGKVVIKVKE